MASLPPVSSIKLGVGDSLASTRVKADVTGVVPLLGWVAVDFPKGFYFYFQS